MGAEAPFRSLLQQLQVGSVPGSSVAFPADLLGRGNGKSIAPDQGKAEEHYEQEDDAAPGVGAAALMTVSASGIAAPLSASPPAAGEGLEASAAAAAPTPAVCELPSLPLCSGVLGGSQSGPLP